MLTNDELWEKAATNESITCEDIGLPSWRSECDGLVHELHSLFCRSGFAYKHKDRYRRGNSDFLTKKELRVYRLKRRKNDRF